MPKTPAHTPIAAQSDGTIGLREVSSRSALGTRLADVIFVHGLGGSSRETWSASMPGGPPTFDWTVQLSNDFPKFGVWTYDYPDGMSIPLRARNLCHHLRLSELGNNPIVFICHSMGGLVVKNMIVDCWHSTVSQEKNISEMVQGIVFLATPHRGSALAKALSVLGRFLGSKRSNVNEMIVHSTVLDMQHDSFLSWRSEHPIRVQSYAETVPLKVKRWFLITKTIGLVVERASANPNIPDCEFIDTDYDHIMIAKPTAESHPVYVSVAKFLRKLEHPLQERGRWKIGIVDDQPDEQSRVGDYIRHLMEREQFGASLPIIQSLDARKLINALETWQRSAAPEMTSAALDVPRLIVCDMYMGEGATTSLLFRILALVARANERLPGSPIEMIVTTELAHRAIEESVLRRLDNLLGQPKWLALIGKPGREDSRHDDAQWLGALRAVSVLRANEIRGDPFQGSRAEFSGEVGRALGMQCDRASEKVLVLVVGARYDGIDRVISRLTNGAFSDRHDAIEVPTTAEELDAVLQLAGGRRGEKDGVLRLDHCEFNEVMADRIRLRFSYVRETGCRTIATCPRDSRWETLLQGAGATIIRVPRVEDRTVSASESTALLASMRCSIDGDRDSVLESFATIVREKRPELRDLEDFFADSAECRTIGDAVLAQMADWLTSIQSGRAD